MVHDDRPVGLDRVDVVFDDERVVSDAGVMLVSTLAQRLGVEAMAGRLVRLRGDRPGRANAGRKVMALVFAMILGADCVDDCDVLRAGRTGRLTAKAQFAEISHEALMEFGLILAVPLRTGGSLLDLA